MSQPTRNPMMMSIRISIQHQGQYGGNGISIEHQLELNAEDFMECARILAQFDELKNRIQSEKGFKSK